MIDWVQSFMCKLKLLPTSYFIFSVTIINLAILQETCIRAYTNHSAQQQILASALKILDVQVLRNLIVKKVSDKMSCHRAQLMFSLIFTVYKIFLQCLMGLTVSTIEPNE